MINKKNIFKDFMFIIYGLCILVFLILVIPFKSELKKHDRIKTSVAQDPEIQDSTKFGGGQSRGSGDGLNW